MNRKKLQPARRVPLGRPMSDLGKRIAALRPGESIIVPASARISPTRHARVVRSVVAYWARASGLTMRVYALQDGAALVEAQAQKRLKKEIDKRRYNP